jgi:hypothetical protein
VAIKDGDQKTFINRRGISDRLKSMDKNLWKMKIPESFIGKKARASEDSAPKGTITEIHNETQYVKIDFGEGRRPSSFWIERVTILDND